MDSKGVFGLRNTNEKFQYFPNVSYNSKPPGNFFEWANPPRAQRKRKTPVLGTKNHAKTPAMGQIFPQIQGKQQKI